MNDSDWGPKYNPADIPRPETQWDYVACYRTNLQEARQKLEWARARYQQFRDAGQITPKVDGGWECVGPTAKQVLADVIRWRSDLAHWSQRLAEAEAETRGVAKVLALPAREPGEDDAA